MREKKHLLREKSGRHDDIAEFCRDFSLTGIYQSLECVLSLQIQ